jgi:hypothetical protein
MLAHGTIGRLMISGSFEIMSAGLYEDLGSLSKSSSNLQAYTLFLSSNPATMGGKLDWRPMASASRKELRGRFLP